MRTKERCIGLNTLWIAVTCVAAAACSPVNDSNQNGSSDRLEASGISHSEKPVFTTDADRYVAVIEDEGRRQVKVDIPMTYTNPTDRTVYMTGCRGPSMPSLHKLEGDEWVRAYSPVELLCLGPPTAIEPGESYRDTLHVTGYFPGQNTAPTFETEVEGTYRLVRSVFADPDGEQSLPDSLRISNTFELVLREGQ